VAINQTAKALMSQQILPVFTEGDASNLFYHSFFYRDAGDYVCISIEEEISNYVTSYDVYVNQGSNPTHLEYDAKGEKICCDIKALAVWFIATFVWVISFSS
jgi:hypothetical protein